VRSFVDAIRASALAGGAPARRAFASASFACSLVLCLAFCVDASAGDANADAFVSCAVRYAAPLHDEADLDALRDIVASASVVALGEPAHGAQTPLLLRNRVIQYVVEHLGFTAVALETSFGESRPIYDFVIDGSDPTSARAVAQENLTWGFGSFPENAVLIRWLRDYNAKPAHARKVHFYGIDLSGADNHGSFSRARESIDRSLDALGQVAPAQAAQLRQRMASTLALFSDQGFAKLSAAQDKDLEHALQSIAEGFSTHRSALISRLGRDRYEWAVHELAVAQRMQVYFRAAPKNGDTGAALPPEGYLQDEIRDAAMAENVRWVLKHEGPDGRVLVFAHNAHVMNAPLRGGIWSVYPRAPRAMGSYLRATMSDSLAIIGTLAATDAPDSAEAILARLGRPPFLLDLHKAACDKPAAAWLSQRRAIRANFDTELDIQLRNAFDAIFYLDRIERRK
jgi:erythromycin esterase